MCCTRDIQHESSGASHPQTRYANGAHIICGLGYSWCGYIGAAGDMMLQRGYYDGYEGNPMMAEDMAAEVKCGGMANG